MSDNEQIGVLRAARRQIYAHCIDGQADAANQRITDALGPEHTDA